MLCKVGRWKPLPIAAAHEVEDYSSEDEEGWRGRFLQPLIGSLLLSFGESKIPESVAGVWVPVLKWHPEVDSEQEVMGYINADTTRWFRVLATVNGWALIADADHQLIDDSAVAEIQEDPDHLDSQPDRWDFDRLSRDTSRDSEYDWHPDIEDTNFKMWVKNGMGSQGKRLHEEMRGCVTRMRAVGTGWWKPVRRVFVWVSTEFLMPTET